MCRLCRKEGQLQASHIFPEFFYDGVYGEKHTTFLVSKSSRRTPQKMQKGVREHLLCHDCEQRFARLESYAVATLRRADAEFENGKDRVALENVDFSTLRLFALSVLWRAHAAESKVFAAVELGPHGEEIRSRLIARNPGAATEYGFALARVTGLGLHGTMVESPQRAKFHGFW